MRLVMQLPTGQAAYDLWQARQNSHGLRVMHARQLNAAIDDWKMQTLA